MGKCTRNMQNHGIFLCKWSITRNCVFQGLLEFYISFSIVLWACLFIVFSRLNAFLLIWVSVELPFQVVIILTICKCSNGICRYYCNQRISRHLKPSYPPYSIGTNNDLIFVTIHMNDRLQLTSEFLTHANKHILQKYHNKVSNVS